MTETVTLSAKQRRFVAALLTAKSMREAARQAGISDRSCWRYLAAEPVRAELARRQDTVLAHVARRLAAEMEQALDVLHEVMVSRDAPDAPRVSAARAVLDSGLRLAEFVALAERVKVLEERLERRK